MILRRVARPLLAAVFVSGGIQTLRNPKLSIELASPVLDGARDSLPAEPESVVMLDAAVKVGAGLALGFGKLPRLSALLLAGSLVPTTAVHRFWELDDPEERAAQKFHFLKNLGLLGGLLIAAADTHGRPSLTWRAKHATRGAAHNATNTVRRLT